MGLAPAMLRGILADTRVWRAGPGATQLGTLLAAAPVLTSFRTDADI